MPQRTWTHSSRRRRPATSRSAVSSGRTPVLHQRQTRGRTHGVTAPTAGVHSAAQRSRLNANNAQGCSTQVAESAFIYSSATYLRMQRLSCLAGGLCGVHSRQRLFQPHVNLPVHGIGCFGRQSQLGAEDAPCRPIRELCCWAAAALRC